jgi:hypothetical protein
MAVLAKSEIRSTKSETISKHEFFKHQDPKSALCLPPSDRQTGKDEERRHGLMGTGREGETESSSKNNRFSHLWLRLRSAVCLSRCEQRKHARERRSM